MYLFRSIRWNASCRATIEVYCALDICTTVSCKTTSSNNLGTFASLDLVIINFALAETGFRTEILLYIVINIFKVDE
jgi:hypothetical protein